MRILRLKFPHLRGYKGNGKPQWVDNPSAPDPAEVVQHGDTDQYINVPLWPDDDYKAHPMSPQPLKVAPYAMRVLATMSGLSPFGPRAVKVSQHGALRVAPEQGNRLDSLEGSLDAGTGAVTPLINPPASSIYIANDDAANAITFQVAPRVTTDGKSADYGTASTQTIPAGSQPIAIDVTAYGVNLPASGNTSAYRIWWIH